MKRAKTIDQFLSKLTPDKRAALQNLRATIKAAAPKAEETISYGIPAFKLNGRMLVWFGAASKHCSFYPGAYPIAKHKSALARYSVSKGTVRFPPDRPLPASLVRTLVKARIHEQAANAARRK